MPGHTHEVLEVSGLQSALDGKAPITHTHTASGISDSTATGQSLVTAADAAAARSTLGLGSIATQSAGSVNITGGTVSGVSATVTTLRATGEYILGRSGGTANVGLGLIGSAIGMLHPEDNDFLLLPYFVNDIAYNITRGGSATVVSGPSPGNLSALFDAGASVCGWYPTPSEPVVLEIVLHKTFLWNAYIGFSGAESFRAKNVVVEARNATTSEWITVATLNNYSRGTWAKKIVFGSDGFNALRFTFSNYANAAGTASFRLSQIFVVNFESMLGRETFLPRDGGEVYGRLAVATKSDALVIGQAGASPSGKLSVDGDVAPYTDNARSCGTAARRWAQVYAVNGAIQTSDARLKTPMRPMSEAEIAAAKDIAAEIGVFQWLSAVAEKGGAARLHVGITVQRVIEIMSSHGLDPMRYGIVCYDRWDALDVIEDGGDDTETGEPLQGRVVRVREAGDQYSLRIDQLALFIARGLEARLSALERLLP